MEPNLYKSIIEKINKIEFKLKYNKSLYELSKNKNIFNIQEEDILNYMIIENPNNIKYINEKFINEKFIYNIIKYIHKEKIEPIYYLNALSVYINKYYTEEMIRLVPKIILVLDNPSKSDEYLAVTNDEFIINNMNGEIYNNELIMDYYLLVKENFNYVDLVSDIYIKNRVNDIIKINPYDLIKYKSNILDISQLKMCIDNNNKCVELIETINHLNESELFELMDYAIRKDISNIKYITKYTLLERYIKREYNKNYIEEKN